MVGSQPLGQRPQPAEGGPRLLGGRRPAGRPSSARRPRATRARGARAGAAARASGAKPAFAGSSSTLTWRSTVSRSAGAPSARAAGRTTSRASRSSRRARSRVSTDSMTSNSSTARRALFDWSGPTRCHRAPTTKGTFAAASWTRFSPRRSRPAATAARIRSAGTVFETATSRTVIGSRPAARGGVGDPGEDRRRGRRRGPRSQPGRAGAGPWARTTRRGGRRRSPARARRAC